MPSQTKDASARLVELTERLLAIVGVPDRDRRPETEMRLVEAIRALGAKLERAGRKPDHPILQGQLSGPALAAWLRLRRAHRPRRPVSDGKRHRR